MNTKLLRKIKKTILERPKRVDMSVWTRSHPASRGGPTCGTVGCIAGWACLLSEKKGKGFAQKREALVGGEFGIDFATEGARLLGLTYAQSGRLFYVGEWPGKECEAYSEATTDKATAQAVARRIDLFIRSKGKK